MNLGRFALGGMYALGFAVKPIKDGKTWLAVVMLLFLWALAGCSAIGPTTLEGNEQLLCSPDIRFINHTVTCQKERGGNWVNCQLSGSVANDGNVRIPNVVVVAEFGHVLYGVRSSSFNLLGDLDPGQQADFSNTFFYYEPLTQYDIRVECADTASAQPSPVPTPKVSFTHLGLDDDIFALAIDPTNPTTLYAGTQTQGVFKSTDGGLNWIPMNTGLVNLKIGDLVIDPFQPTTIYAGTYGSQGDDGAAYKSTDAGETWTEISNGMGGAYVFSLVMDPLATSTVFAGTSDGIFKTTDGGEQWTRLAAEDPDPYIHQLIIDPVTPANLYAIDSGELKGIFKSTNSGDDWLLREPEFDYMLRSLVIDPMTPRTLYAGTDQGVFKSVDAGETWRAVNSGLGEYAIVTALIIDPSRPATLYAAIQNNDIFTTTDGGESWSALGSNLGDTFIWALKLDPANPRNIYAATENGVFILGK